MFADGADGAFACAFEPDPLALLLQVLNGNECREPKSQPWQDLKESWTWTNLPPEYWQICFFPFFFLLLQAFYILKPRQQTQGPFQNTSQNEFERRITTEIFHFTAQTAGVWGFSMDKHRIWNQLEYCMIPSPSCTSLGATVINGTVFSVTAYFFFGDQMKLFKWKCIYSFLVVLLRKTLSAAAGSILKLVFCSWCCWEVFIKAPTGRCKSLGSNYVSAETKFKNYNTRKTIFQRINKREIGINVAFYPPLLCKYEGRCVTEINSLWSVSF